MKEIPLNNGMVALVDDEDYESLSQWKWTARKSRKVWYAARGYVCGGRVKQVLMHRQILNSPAGVQVDHKDHDGLNNTRENLREATHGQNQQNKNLQKNNTSGYRGVSWHQRTKNWVAYVYFDGRRKELGRFRKIEDAVVIANEARRKYHREFCNV